MISDWLPHQLEVIKSHLNTVINANIFAETPQQYRQLFACVCYAEARYLICRDYILDEIEENISDDIFLSSQWTSLCNGKTLLLALKVLDEGIMKGVQFDDNNLGKLAAKICSALPPLPAIDIPSTSYPVPPSLSNSTTVTTFVRPSFEEFLKHMDHPILIKGLVSHFPLFEYFDFYYLNEKHGYRRVPIELGSSYAGDDYSQEIITIHEYLKNCLNSKEGPQAYLAQHALLDQLNLLNDVPIPDYASLLSSEEEESLVNVFIGPSGTISPLHCDPRVNFFCQIRGRKFVRLVDSRFHDDVYLNPDPMYANSSLADFEAPDFEQFPKLKDIKMEDVVMEEGDCLFMPAKYFHLMRSLSPSISVSIWI